MKSRTQVWVLILVAAIAGGLPARALDDFQLLDIADQLEIECTDLGVCRPLVLAQLVRMGLDPRRAVPGDVRVRIVNLGLVGLNGRLPTLTPAGIAEAVRVRRERLQWLIERQFDACENSGWESLTPFEKLGDAQAAFERFRLAWNVGLDPLPERRREGLLLAWQVWAERAERDSYTVPPPPEFVANLRRAYAWTRRLGPEIPPARRAAWVRHQLSWLGAATRLERAFPQEQVLIGAFRRLVTIDAEAQLAQARLAGEAEAWSAWQCRVIGVMAAPEPMAIVGRLIHTVAHPPHAGGWTRDHFRQWLHALIDDPLALYGFAGERKVSAVRVFLPMVRDPDVAALVPGIGDADIKELEARLTQRAAQFGCAATALNPPP